MKADLQTKPCSADMRQGPVVPVSRASDVTLTRVPSGQSSADWCHTPHRDHGGGIVCPRPPSVADWFPQPRIFRNYSENTRDLVPGDGCIIHWSHSPGLGNNLSLPPDDRAPRLPAHTGHMSPVTRDTRDSWLNLVSCHQDLCHHLTISGPHVTVRLSEPLQLHLYTFYMQSSQIKYKWKLSNLVSCFWCFLGAEGISGWELPSSGCSLLKCYSEPNKYI